MFANSAIVVFGALRVKPEKRVDKCVCLLECACVKIFCLAMHLIFVLMSAYSY